MKLLTTFAFSLLFFGSIFAQDIDGRLLQSYSEVELAELIKSDSDKYNILINSIGSAIEIVDFPKGKESKVVNSISVPEGTFTYLDLNLKIQDSNQYFKIEGTDKLLVVKSFFVLANELK